MTMEYVNHDHKDKSKLVSLAGIFRIEPFLSRKPGVSLAK